MWLRWSHTLAPLTRLMYIKRIFKQTQFEQDALDKIKRIVARDTFLTYPDSNETFKIYTDAIEFQVGVVISQKYKPIDFYSIKLTDAQRRYTVTDK